MSPYTVAPARPRVNVVAAGGRKLGVRSRPEAAENIGLMDLRCRRRGLLQAATGEQMVRFRFRQRL
jgi:hypothetical protein